MWKSLATAFKSMPSHRTLSTMKRYFPADLQANPRFQERLNREVPLGRLVSPSEDANFAAYLCSDAADCFVGQVFPVCGSWVTR